MTAPSSPPASPRHLIWQRVYKDLIKHAHPDSRFHYDFLSFVPDFRDSASALAHLVQLPAYQSASTILATPDASLEALRHRALKDGKKLLVGTYRLRRGFVLLSPLRIADDELRLAACLDGMETPGIGRHVSLAQLREEGVRVDLCVLGALAFSTSGVVVWEGAGLFEVQWALLRDVGVVQKQVPVVGVAHGCQVVDEAELGLARIAPGGKGEVQCDYVATPETLIEISDAVKPEGGVDFDAVDPEALENIAPLQELKGIRMMEAIMRDGGFAEKKEEKEVSAEEQAGIDMMERIMKGFKMPS